jgi:DedD protein
MITEPRNEARLTARASGHAKRPTSSLVGLKPFLLAGLLVVIGLLVGLNFLLGDSGESSPTNGEPTPGAITIGPPPGGSLSSDASPGQETPPTATTPGTSMSATGSTPSGQAPITPSEFTFYETLKKAPHDPAATVGLTPQKSQPKARSKTAPKPAAKPAPAKNRVIDTTTADKSTFHYTVQVAAFRQKSMAEEMIKALSKKGHEAYLMTASLSDGVTYRVRVGRFATREEADRTAEQLAAKEKLHPFITTIEPG